MTAAAYHADPCGQLSLSASIARIICQDSPLHAWTAHHRLNPNYVPEYSHPMDLGSICHALLLEGVDKMHVIRSTKKLKKGDKLIDTGEPIEDYKTESAREERDTARAAGKCPVLPHEVAGIETMLKACRIQLQSHKEASNAFTNGKPEQTLIWQEPNGVWCRARLDWLHDDYRFIDDYKTTGGSANPEQVSRNLFRDGLDIQAAFYLRGLIAATTALAIGSTCALCDVVARDTQFRFVFQEWNPPHAVSVIGLSPSALAIGSAKVEYAIQTFGECLNTGQWPGYPQRVCYAEIPPYEEQRWMERSAQ